MRKEHWVDGDLIGKGKHIRTVPVPVWAKRAVDEWVNATDISDGPISHRRRSGISLRRRPPGLKSRIWLRMIFDACAPAYAISRAASGADPVPPRPRIGPNNGALSRVQGEASGGG